MKRKHAVLSYPTLAEGIPQLARNISETGPSIPTDDDHPKATTVEKDFGLLEELAFEKIKGLKTNLRTVNGCIRYSTENDIARHVGSFVESVVDALNLTGEVEVSSEVGVFKLRPDLWVVSYRAMRIGVIEVKKPDVIKKIQGEEDEDNEEGGKESTEGDEIPKRRSSRLAEKQEEEPDDKDEEAYGSALEHPNVLGELYDFMKHLPNFYGVYPAFGILTNMNAWRIAWVPHDETDQLAAKTESIVEETSDEEASQGETAELQESKSSESVGAHLIIMDQETEVEEDDEGLAEDEALTDRLLHVSNIYHKDDGNHVVVRAVASAVLKMSQAKRLPFDSPFDRLSERSLLKFEKGVNATVFWTRLKLRNGPQWDKIASPKRFLYAIEDLGYGAHGRVWLTCTSSGAICVLKFSLGDNNRTRDLSLDHEKKMWDSVYGPDIVVFRESWCGEPALRMPHFARVEEADQEDTIELVKSTLLDDYHVKGFIHCDVAWRNIGLYKTTSNEEKAVVFDMGRVRPLRESEKDGKWVKTACKKLRQTMGY